jgi:Mitochondrial ATP synthase B chain precursor (ATP-synt_B)
MFSWILNILLGNIPGWVWPALAGGSFVINLLSGILSNLPQFKPWHMFIKPLSWVGILVGVFMYGGAGVTAIYQKQIEEMQAKVEAAEAKADQANQDLHNAVQGKVKIVKEVQTVFKDRIKEVQVQVDKDCKVDASAIDALNEVAKGGKQ